MSKKRLAIMGSTGSIGTQALDVVSRHPSLFEVSVLTANENADLLIEQAIRFKPNVVVIAKESCYEKVEAVLWDHEIKVYTGAKSLEDVVQMEEVDLVLTGIVGIAGLPSTIKAIEAKKTIALANKETLVVAGAIMTKLAKENNVNILPVDSEHSAIFQCLVGEHLHPVEKIYLTASGGPFRGFTLDELSKVTPEQALEHPNWDMGKKITIDSATMMNKGFEVIEARWLFDLKPEQIEVIVHPESVIHSMVQFKDGSVKAQLGIPDMRIPIQFALSYPKRLELNTERFDFRKFPALHFDQPDFGVFKNLQLAYDALKRGGNIPAAMNASNEIGVGLFLDRKISLTDIADINLAVCERIDFVTEPKLVDLFETDRLARALALELAKV